MARVLITGITGTGLGTLRLLEAVRQNVPECRFFLAATSEIFGEPVESPQSESTPVAPVNPYAAAKLYALNLVLVEIDSGTAHG